MCYFKSGEKHMIEANCLWHVPVLKGSTPAS